MDIFVQQLRKAMFLKGWRQVDLKNALNESDGQISSWYNGRYRPNAEKMAKIANALCVSVDYLLGKLRNAKQGRTGQKWLKMA